MITKNFKPFKDANLRFGYHDDDIWSGNKPLSINRTVVKKYVITVPRYKWDFNFGDCEYSYLPEGLRIYKCYLDLCDHWHIEITSSGSDYWITFSRLTDEQCIKYDLVCCPNDPDMTYNRTDKIAVYNGNESHKKQYLTPTVEQREMIENIILMKVEDCFIWNEIIQPFLIDMYKKYSKGNLEFSKINKK